MQQRQSASIYVDIRAQGAEFNIASTAWAVTLDLNGHFTDLLDMAVQGTAAFALGRLDLGDAGCIDVDTDVTASLGLSVSDPQQDPTLIGTASLTVEILGHSFTLLNASLTTDADFFQHLDALLVEQIVKNVLAAPGVWLSWVKDGLVSIAKSIAQVLKDTFNVAGWQDAARLMSDAGFEFVKILNQIATAFGIAKADVAAFLESLSKDCSMEAVNDLTNGTARFDLFAAAQGALVQVAPRGEGNSLLYAFYSNKDALEQVIRNNPSIWHAHALLPGAAGMLAVDPVAHLIDGLGETLPHLPRENRREVRGAIDILERHRSTTWVELLDRLAASS